MTAKDRVRAKYPDAYRAKVDISPWLIYTAHVIYKRRHTNKPFAVGLTRKEAWENAAKKVKQ